MRDLGELVLHYKLYFQTALALKKQNLQTRNADGSRTNGYPHQCACKWDQLVFSPELANLKF